MRPPNEHQAVQEIAERLAELLGVATSDAQTRAEPGTPDTDAVIGVGEFNFVVEWKNSGAAAAVANAIDSLWHHASATDRQAIPLVAVPFMGPVGRRRCEEAGVAWLDLSGNARILAPGIHVLVEGRPNRFKRPGRPSSAFAPKSSRIARWLLMHPNQPVTQREIARSTGMDEGFTSRIVAKLEEDDLVVRDRDGAIRARDPDVLLDAWREVYEFSKHQILRGHVPARSGDELLRRLVNGLQAHRVEHAATGLAAAWLLVRFAGFRLATMYVRECPAPDLLTSLGFREEASGANVRLVIPADEGVFQGAGDREGIRCVHPVQVYLDLKDHPERAKEVADHLRAELLTWSRDG